MKKRVILFLILLITLSYGCTQAEVKEEMQEAGELSEMDTKPLVADEPAEILEEGAAEETSMEPPEELKKPSWAYEGITLPGNYADSDILKLDDGKYRMYYALEPEVPGFRGQVYSALSSDGIDWEKEGERLSGISFPSVLQIPNGKFRMYFQEAGVIKSAISPDGLSWEKEPGIRVDTSNTNGFSFENVAAPTVIREGEEYIMVYSGLMNEQYSDELLPNRDTRLFLWATSKDGLTFEKKGVALDSRSPAFKGFMDGPELVQWDDGSVRLFFWGYFGIYESEFAGGMFTEPKMVYEAKDDDPMHAFPSNPPGDPTLGLVNGKWLMYYGIHEQGIFYAALKDN